MTISALALFLIVGIGGVWAATGYQFWGTAEPGGVSINGDYRLTGVVGQPDAAPVARGNGYQLRGGFLQPATGGVQTEQNKTYLAIVMFGATQNDIQASAGSAQP